MYIIYNTIPGLAKNNWTKYAERSTFEQAKTYLEDYADERFNDDWSMNYDNVLTVGHDLDTNSLGGVEIVGEWKIAFEVKPITPSDKVARFKKLLLPLNKAVKLKVNLNLLPETFEQKVYVFEVYGGRIDIHVKLYAPNGMLVSTLYLVEDNVNNDFNIFTQASRHYVRQINWHDTLILSASLNHLISIAPNIAADCDRLLTRLGEV